MAHNFGSLVFTPTIKALQEKHGSRRQYSRVEESGPARDRLGPTEREFLAERDNFYIASVGSTGWPYIQHRGGPVGFLKVIDDKTLAFANFSGNRQYISSGNLATDSRVALIFIDYPRQARLKILGRAAILEGDAAGKWIEQVRHPEYKAAVESVYLIHVEAFDWNCPQHIVPRFTAEEIQQALAPAERRMKELEQENERLRQALATKPRSRKPASTLGHRHSAKANTTTESEPRSHGAGNPALDSRLSAIGPNQPQQQQQRDDAPRTSESVGGAAESIDCHGISELLPGCRGAHGKPANGS